MDLEEREVSQDALMGATIPHDKMTTKIKVVFRRDYKATNAKNKIYIFSTLTTTTIAATVAVA